MGSATIWYYPDPAGTIEAVTLPYVSDIVQPVEDVTYADRTLGGGGYVRRFASQRRFALGIEKVTSAATVRDLYALESHLNRGGVIGVAFDADKAWSGYALRPPRRGDTEIKVQPMALYNTSATLSSGDEVWVQSASPERNEELAVVSSLSGGVLTLQSGLRYSYLEQPITIRHRRYFPAGTRAVDEIGSPLVASDDRQLTHAATITLDESRDAIDALVAEPQVRGSAGSAFRSLTEVMEERATRRGTGIGFGATR